jgi:hypothetical protein
MKRMLMLLLGTLLLSGIVAAHGDEQHIMGTVTRVTNKAITVRPQEDKVHKKSVTVNVVAATKFEKMGAAATVKDIKVGDRVAIHAEKKGDQLEAQIVKIGMTMGDKKQD